MEGYYNLFLVADRSYREVSLTPESEDVIQIGTLPGCFVRYARENFFEHFSLRLERTYDGWRIVCSDEVYVTQDGVLRLQSLDLTAGQYFRVFNRSNIELFRCSVMLDFSRFDYQYTREIHLQGLERITIGKGAADIDLQGEQAEDDSITLIRDGKEWVLSGIGRKYGISFNGMLIQDTVRVRDYDFFSLFGYSFFFKGERLYTDPKANCQINLPYEDRPESTNCFSYPTFRRTTRIQYQVPEQKLEVLPAPPMQVRDHKSILFTLLPSLFMLVLIVMLRGVMGGGGAFVIFSACSMGVGIITSVITYITDRRKEKETEAKRQANYYAYLEEKEQEIQALRSRELKVRRWIYTGLEDILTQINGFDDRLFERAPADVDFLDICIGQGDVEAPNQAEYKPLEFKNGEDSLELLAGQLAEQYRFLKDAPVALKLMEDNCLGVVGNQHVRAGTLRRIALDLASRHYFAEVKLVFLIDDAQFRSFDSLRWLPHVRQDKSDLRFFAPTNESRSLLLEFLYNELTSREAIKADPDQADVRILPHYVVFVYGDHSLGQHPISRYFEGAGALGFTFLFFVSHRELLPRGCGEILTLKQGEEDSAVTATWDGEWPFAYKPHIVEQRTMDSAVKKLAAIEIDEISLESALMQNVTLFDLLEIITPEDLDLQQRWSTSEVFRSMAAPLGVDKNSDIVYLDIGDKASAHGPHGLVAGTTGSGKSEILQTYILSMSLLFHPFDVAFVLIDFKGGGMANQFTSLPHLLGAITNIDGREIDRSLRSIKAELLRRQGLFAAAGVNHINDYIKKFKKQELHTPLPHLIIIVDEFAELKSEFPDFMKELISAARIGRTLGVHLILATQKPSGQVDAQIWANSKFRLCLKVQNREDSNEVLKSPLAAEIKEPGRAYFQVGNNEIFTLFQSAYGGADVPDIEHLQKTFQLHSVAPWGERTLLYSTKEAKSEQSKQSQQQALLDYIAGFCQEKSIEKLAGICLPPLSEQLALPEVEQPETPFGVQIAIGQYDDPDQQAQAPYCLNLTASNTYIVGSAQMGKTNLLKTIGEALIASYSPKEVNLYIIDCGNMELRVFEESNHVGGVVLTTQEEKMINLFKLMRKLVEQRRNRFSEKGIGTFASYLEAGYQDMPQVVLMIDNVAAFREYYEEMTDELLFISREGISVGITCILTATQANAINYRLQANFNTRIAFTCTDNGDYSALFGRVRMEPKTVPGRALVAHEKRILECQTAQVGMAEREVDRVQEMRAYIQSRNKACPEEKALPIPMVPEKLLAHQVFREGKPILDVPYHVPVGMNYATVSFAVLDLAHVATLNIMGETAASRAQLILYLFEALYQNMLENPVEAYVFDDGTKELEPLSDYGFVDTYTTDIDKASVLLEDLEERIKERSEDGATLQSEPLLILVLSSRMLFRTIAAEKALTQKMAQIMKLSGQAKCLVICSAIENTQPGFQSPEYVKLLREQKQGIFLGDLVDCRFYEITPKQLRDASRVNSSNDGYYIQGAQVHRLKIVQREEHRRG